MDYCSTLAGRLEALNSYTNYATKVFTKAAIRNGGRHLRDRGGLRLDV